MASIHVSLNKGSSISFLYLVMVSCVTGCTTPLATCSMFRGSALLSILHCSSCRNAFAVKVCNACWDTLAGAWHIKFILLRQGDLLGFGGAASLSLSASIGKSSSVGASVSSSSSTSLSCVIGMGLLPIAVRRRTPSEHTHGYRLIA